MQLIRHKFFSGLILCLLLISAATGHAGTAEDIDHFARRAAKLARLCEGALKDGSYLDRLSNSDQLTSSKDLRPIYRFWKLYLSFSADIEKIAEKYEVPLIRHNSPEIQKNFENYLLGISARLTQMVLVSDLMNFLRNRPKLELLLNEANPEFDMLKNSLRRELNRVIQVKDLARLYRFRLENYERMMKFYQGELAQKPVFDRNHVLFALIQSHRMVLNHLLKSVASKPAWKILANTVFDKALDFILPAQKAIFTWVGDTRIKSKQSRLVSKAQVKEFEEMLQPGDIILERQDWYLSNLFLPGFWPHGIIYLGDKQKFINFFKSDQEVNNWCRKHNCQNFLELLAKGFPEATGSYFRKNEDGHANVVIEAISEGVVFSSIEHSCKADYLAALRPNLSKINIARSIYQAFYYFGREYDFRFNFESEQTLVCTELVSKAYCRKDNTGLNLPYTLNMGKYGVTADGIARTFASEHGKPGPQMNFVAFLLGIPASGKATFSDVETFKKSPGWRGGLISSDLD